MQVELDCSRIKKAPTLCCDLSNNVVPVTPAFSLHTHHMTEHLVNVSEGFGFWNATGVIVPVKRRRQGLKVQLLLYFHLTSFVSYFSLTHSSLNSCSCFLVSS